MDTTSRHLCELDYDGFLARIQARFQKNLAGGALLFTTNASGLWEAYLDSFGSVAFGPYLNTNRQLNNCSACRHFIERFGGLVVIDAKGKTTPAIWDEADALGLYKPAIAAMARLVWKADVTGVFLSSEHTWGTPETGIWRHMAVRPPTTFLYKGTSKTAEQAMAEKREDFKTLRRALGGFTAGELETAVRLLRSDALYRGEKLLGQAEWLLDLKRKGAKGGRSRNLVWRAVASAPAGFCHPRSSMIGTLLEDIAAGLGFEEVSQRFKEKMHPLAYQRPQAAPTAGAIAAAEKIIQQLDAAGSLARRFARLEDIPTIWKPKPVPFGRGYGDTVFSHLKPKGADGKLHLRAPAQKMTWEKFQRTVLPTADRMEFRAPHQGPYAALVTAVNPDAPPILQWDTEAQRNPVSWYFWPWGASAETFGLVGETFVPVTAVTYKPSQWNGGFEHHGRGVMFVLDGARETRCAGNALFPEILKAEFHSIRSVLEAYSRTAKIEGLHEPHVAGVMLTQGAEWDVVVRVWSGDTSLDYCLDRWD